MASAKKKDLFAGKSGDAAQDNYTASDIEVLEGLEPVRLRPGMYIGGTDDRALHHLFAEVIDNSMDEAVAGHATRIEVELDEEGYISVTDNGRGIPVGPHPKFPKKSALEVILTELHSGGKFSNTAYETSGGLHGVGVSVVNALSDVLEVEIARNKTLHTMRFERGKPIGKIKNIGAINNRRGTKLRFHPDAEIFGKALQFRAAKLFNMSRAKAYLQPGVEIRWKCAPSKLKNSPDIPETAVFHFPGGLADYLSETLGTKATITETLFSGKSKKDSGHGRVEWAISWSPEGYGEADSFVRSYCNTVPTPGGGTHEAGLRAAITKGLRAYADLTGMGKKVSHVTPDDVMFGAGAEGDSAGGSAKQARSRETQAILPLKGKILNVESATRDKIHSNSEINDLSVALGVGLGRGFDVDDLRYERVVIMTDADVDGAHIAALLITFFYRYTPGLIEAGRLYMAMPPLYKMTAGAKTVYAVDDIHREELMKTEFKGKTKVDIGRFKGLGEMNPAQLKVTTMDPATRTLARITLDPDEMATTESLVGTLMGKRSELRFEYIQEHAQFVEEVDI